MKNHSMIVDEFFIKPDLVKSLINKEEMTDRLYVDGVTYPNIVTLPHAVETEVQHNLNQLFGPFAKIALSFARYSLNRLSRHIGRIVIGKLLSISCSFILTNLKFKSLGQQL